MSARSKLLDSGWLLGSGSSYLLSYGIQRYIKRNQLFRANRQIGERAAQVVPHVHFHIIPRPATGANQRTSFAMFGRGQREELDDDEAEVLAREIRLELVDEVKRIQEEEGVDLAAGLIPDSRGKL